MDALAEPRPVAVWSGPYRRAIPTVQPTADALGLPVRTRWGLREWNDGLPYTDDWEPHYAESWADSTSARPGGGSLGQLTARAVDAVRALVQRHCGHVVLAASHGTFMSRALSGFGVPVDWGCARSMPMPAIYRLRFAHLSTNPPGVWTQPVIARRTADQAVGTVGPEPYCLLHASCSTRARAAHALTDQLALFVTVVTAIGGAGSVVVAVLLAVSAGMLLTAPARRHFTGPRPTWPGPARRPTPDASSEASAR